MSDVASFVRFCESSFGAEVMERESSYVSRHVSHEDTVLDVGCGIGSLEERLDGYDVVGLDRSGPMVRAARERVAAPFVQGDARNLPAATSSVDAVVFVATLEFIPAVDAVLSEAVRVLGAGGTLVALVLNTRSEYVQSNLEREGSYFQRMVHRDSRDLTAKLLAVVDGTREYLVGVEDGAVVDDAGPSTAAVTAVAGTLQSGAVQP